MASRTITEVIDDLTGKPAAESVQFGLDGITYEIDLSDDNATRLRKDFFRFIQAGRRTGGKRVPRRHSLVTPESSSTKRDTAPIVSRVEIPAVPVPLTLTERASLKKFAIRTGLTPPANRGRIPKALREAWEAAGRPAR